MTYRNPVIPGFHPDPSVCRVGREFVLVTSSFTYFPGVPVFTSTNLVDWTQVGNALSRPSQLDLAGTDEWASLGVYAPTIRFHDGRYWMITTVSDSSGFRNFFVTAADPAGPWSDPVAVDVSGIDPDLAWDEDGRCWVHYSAIGHIARCCIDDATGAVLEPPEPTWSGTGLQFPEAPHLYERDRSWYLLIAEGGTERGHAVSIARGPSPAGPWEPCPDNPIVSHRSTDRPIQNTGHADLVEAADGSWWVVLLGVRPKGATPGFHVLGRETFLAPVTWRAGWPVVSELSLEMAADPPAPRRPRADGFRDDFDGVTLDPAWVAVRRPPATFASLDARPGWLTLSGQAALDAPDPTFLGRRQQHHQCRVRALVDAPPDVAAGLAVRMDERSHYEVVATGEHVVVAAQLGSLRSELARVARPPGPVTLFLATRPGAYGPDLVSLGFDDPRVGRRTLAELDGRYLSTEATGGFIGRTIGMFAVGGAAAFDWFEYEVTTDSAR